MFFILFHVTRFNGIIYITSIWFLSHQNLNIRCLFLFPSWLLQFDSKKPNDNENAKVFRDKLERDLNDYQTSLDDLWIFYSDGSRQYSDEMQKSFDDSYVNQTELEQIHMKAKMQAIEQVWCEEIPFISLISIRK